jgi:hypothetical protein
VGDSVYFLVTSSVPNPDKVPSDPPVTSTLALLFQPQQAPGANLPHIDWTSVKVACVVTMSLVSVTLKSLLWTEQDLSALRHLFPRRVYRMTSVRPTANLRPTVSASSIGLIPLPKRFTYNPTHRRSHAVFGRLQSVTALATPFQHMYLEIRIAFPGMDPASSPRYEYA